MTPGTRKKAVSLRLNMTGVRIPRHVGTWRVERVFPALAPDGEAVALCVLKHERLETAPRMLATSQGGVLYVKIPDDWQCQLEQKGWKF